MQKKVKMDTHGIKKWLFKQSSDRENLHNTKKKRCLRLSAFDLLAHQSPTLFVVVLSRRLNTPGRASRAAAAGRYFYHFVKVFFHHLPHE